MTQLVQLIVNGLVTGAIIAISAIGLTLVYGILKIVNFAHGEFLTIGAYFAVVANVSWGQNMVVACLFAMGATAVLGVALELILWRPMRRRGAGLVSLFITSIGLALVLRGGIFMIWGSQPRRYSVNQFQVYTIGSIRLSLTQIVAIAIAFVAIVFVGLVLGRTKWGKAMRALSDNRALAAVSGIDVDRVTAYTWMLGAALAGLGGVLLGLVQGSFYPNTGFSLLLPIFAAVILGGVGSAYGALAGGLTLGLFMELSTWTALGGGLSGVYKPVVAFAVLIAALLLRPQGLFGKARLL